MEKNFSKTQTPPRSGSNIEAFTVDVGISPPKYQMTNSPSSRAMNRDDSEDRFTTNRNSNRASYNNQPIDVQLNSPRLSVNSLNQNYNKVEKYNYDPSYGGNEHVKSRHNSIGNGNSNVRMVNNYIDQPNQLFNDLYNNSSSNTKNAMPIFIDDLEEETILDVRN